MSSIARSTDDKIKKNDRRDAKRLASELLNPANDLSRVWLPDEECEGARDLARAYADASDATKRAKLQLIAFLLRHGYSSWYVNVSDGFIDRPSREAPKNQHFASHPAQTCTSTSGLPRRCAPRNDNTGVFRRFPNSFLQSREMPKNQCFASHPAQKRTSTSREMPKNSLSPRA